ncbi:hypothetical protein D3C80_1242870 [compost metagenome]
MLKGIDQPKPPSHQQQHEVQRSAPALALGADQVGQREQQSQPTEHQGTGDQPGGEVAPLNLVAVVVGDIAQQRTKEQRYAARQQQGMQRAGRTAVKGLIRCGHGASFSFSDPGLMVLRHQVSAGCA